MAGRRGHSTQRLAIQEIVPSQRKTVENNVLKMNRTIAVDELVSWDNGLNKQFLMRNC
jgi:hypothetical protein